MLIGSKSRKRPFGATFGFGGSGLVATPEQEAETRRLEALYGIDPLGTGGHTSSIDPVDSGTPQQQGKPPSFWQGGDKFRWQDGVAGALAALGDGLSRQSGGSGGGVEMLAGGRLSAIEQARKAQEAAQARAASVQRLTAAGLPGAQAEVVAAGDAKYGDFKPPNNDTAADYEFWKARMTPEQFKMYVQNKADPPQYRQGDDGRFYRINAATPPTAPVGRLTPIAAGPASGVSPEAEQMRQAYLAANPVDGERMFQEWLQKTGRR